MSLHSETLSLVVPTRKEDLRPDSASTTVATVFHSLFPTWGRVLLSRAPAHPEPPITGRDRPRVAPARPRARSGQVTYVNSRIAPTPTQRSLSRSTYARAPTPEQRTRTPSLRSVHHTPDPLRISSGARRNLPNRHDARSAPTRVSLRAFGAARCGLEKAPRAFGGGSPKSGYVRSACECRGGWCGVERRYWLSRWQLR